MLTVQFLRVFVAAATAFTATPATAQIQLTSRVSDLTNPVFVGHAGDGSNRLFIVEQAGIIKVLGSDNSTPTVFLNITSRVLSGGERGLLGLAFHPLYDSMTNRRFFVAYTQQTDGALVIAEYLVSTANRDVADTAERRILVIPHPTFGNHNGGMLAFGADGFLYIGVGDGGSLYDPQNNAQNLSSLLGKILRIDINSGNPYSSPGSNPFVGMDGRDEIFAIGMRNPRRFSFDRVNDRLWVGDVGEGQRVEVDSPIVPGGNYGWRAFEGTLCTGIDVAACSNRQNYIFPLFEYSHTGARCSLTGGYVYRGAAGVLPAGTYVYGDYCSGEIFTWNGSQNVLLDTATNIASFGEDEAGELYVVNFGGTVSKIVGSAPPPPPPPPPTCTTGPWSAWVPISACVNGQRTEERTRTVSPAGCATTSETSVESCTAPSPPPPPSSTTITLNPSSTQQTIDGWEATDEAGAFIERFTTGTRNENPAFALYKAALFAAAANDLGINRVRLEVRSGFENTTDYFPIYLAGQITKPQMAVYRNTPVNDNADSNTLRSAGFVWGELDFKIDNVIKPLRDALIARGETLHITVDFIGNDNPNVFLKNPNEYAEYMLAVFQHMQQKYGFVPDLWEVANEPDNNFGGNWTATQIGQVIATAGPRLAQHGFTARFGTPSTAGSHESIVWWDGVTAVPGALPYIAAYTYHRYSTPTQSQLTTIKNRALQHGKTTAQLEILDGNYTMLHDDLKYANVSAWQHYILAGAGTCCTFDYFTVNMANPFAPVVQVGTRTKFYRQYFKHVRRGAVRYDATTTNTAFDPLAFRNTDGRHVVVVRASAGGSFSVGTLPAGTYGIFYTTGSPGAVVAYDVTQPDVTLTTAGPLTTSIPAAGVLTIYGKTAAPPSCSTWSTWTDVGSCVNNQQAQERTCLSNPAIPKETRQIACTPPPPPPPACVFSAWSPWAPITECVNGQQTERRTRTANPSTCTPVTETRVVACGSPPPPPPPCTYSINPAQATFERSGGVGTVAVTAGTACAWTALSNASWITVAGGSPGSGNGTVTYTVAAQSGNQSRTGTITVAGQTFNVTQSRK